MSFMTYNKNMEKPLIWLKGEIKTPPFSKDARFEVGLLLRLLQRGHKIDMPKSRPMPSIGAACHELRIVDNVANKTWRLTYRLDDDAIVIGEVFAKKTRATPKQVIDSCKRRMKLYDAIRRDAE